MYIYKDKNVRKNLFDQTSGLSCQSPVFHSVGKKMMLFRDKTWAYPHSVFPVSSPEAVGLLEYIPPHIILLVSTYVNGMVGFIYLIITLTASKLSLEYCNDNFIIKMLCRTKKKKNPSLNFMQKIRFIKQSGNWECFSRFSASSNTSLLFL